ncbi:MAG: DMT family transporter [Rhodobacteraceae bacterium]|nr:MAG: DMT family transporter [Paracoccaceae bacterium]
MTEIIDTPPRQARLATLALALAAVCFGLVPLFARELQAAGLASPVIAFYRYAFTALALAPLFPLAREKRREAAMAFGAGLIAGVGWIGYLEALKVAPVAAAGVVYMSYPVFAVLLAWGLAGQRPTKRAAASGVLVLAAAAAVAPASSGGAALGLLLALPAPFGFALAIVVISALVRRLSTLERMAAALSGSALGLMPLALSGGLGAMAPADPQVWALIFGAALATAFLPQWIYTKAAPMVGPARTAAAGAMELPVMIAVGALAFGEAAGPREALAAALVGAAILLAPAVRAVGATRP